LEEGDERAGDHETTEIVSIVNTTMEGVERFVGDTSEDHAVNDSKIEYDSEVDARYSGDPVGVTTGEPICGQHESVTC
jgi:hypothetical protein